MERSDLDMEEILRKRHEAKDKEEQERRQREQEEEDEEVKKYFYKVQAPAGLGGASGTASADVKGKGKAKAEAAEGGLMEGYGSGSDSDADAEDEDRDKEDTPAGPATVTVKKTAASLASNQPSVQDLLAAKGISLPSVSSPAPVVPKNNIKNAVLAGFKAGGLAGIKRKDAGNPFGVKAKKAKV